MVNRKFPCPAGAVLLSLCLLGPALALAADLDEGVDGDFSNLQDQPTPFALDPGLNRIAGEVADLPLDPDFIRLDVPAGHAVQRIVLAEFELFTNQFDGGMLVALEQGPVVTSLTSSADLRGFVIAGVAPGTTAGEDLLDDLGGPSLGTGPWTLWLQNTGAANRYVLELDVVPAVPAGPGNTVPVPVLDGWMKALLTALLLAFGLAAVARARADR